MPKHSVRVVARLIAQEDSIDKVRTVLTTLIEPSRQEQGCVSYELLRNSADAKDLTVVEEWQTDAALDAHFETAHFHEATTKLQGILAGEPDIRRYRRIA